MSVESDCSDSTSSAPRRPRDTDRSQQILIGRLVGSGRIPKPVLTREASPVWETIPGVDGAMASPGMGAAAQRDAIFRRALGFSDVLGAYLAMLLAVYAVPGSARPLWSDVLIAPVVIVLSKVIGLYDQDQHRLRKATVDELPAILNLAVFFSLGVWLAESILFSGGLDRPQVFMLATASFVFMSAARVITRTVALRATTPERLLVVGSSTDCDRTVRVLEGGETGRTNMVVVGRVRLGHDGRLGGHARGDIPALRQVISETIVNQRVERVIFAPDGCEQEEVLDLIRLIKALGVKLSLDPPHNDGGSVRG